MFWCGRCSTRRGFWQPTALWKTAVADGRICWQCINWHVRLPSDEYLYLYQLLRSLDRAARRGNITGTEELDGVVLTTMHRSKGLEYPVVFLVDLSRKFNFQELKEPVLFDSDMGIGAKITDTEQKLRYPGLCYEAVRYKKRRDLRSEELRVLYVAMTRPKDYLIMTYASEYAASGAEPPAGGGGKSC